MIKKTINLFLSAFLVFSLVHCTSLSIRAEETPLDECGNGNLDHGACGVYYVLNDKGELVPTEINEKSVRSGVLKSIAIYIGDKIIGEVIALVVDGIVTAIKEGYEYWWSPEVARQILNKDFRDSIIIDCNVYPMHSYEGAMCRAA